jgi:hypothetical protein
MEEGAVGDDEGGRAEIAASAVTKTASRSGSASWGTAASSASSSLEAAASGSLVELLDHVNNIIQHCNRLDNGMSELDRGY